MSPSISFNGCWWKVRRAHQHIDEFRKLTSPLSREFYSLRVLRAPGAPAGSASYSLIYEGNEFLDQRLAVIIGDVVHNLRSALDHLATAVARDTDPDAEIHFPMARNREDLVPPREPKSGIEKSLAAIEKSLPGTERLILEVVRPENDVDELLWAFHVIDNNDKHNLIIPVVTVASVSGFDIPLPGGGTVNEVTAANDARSIFGVLQTSLPITDEHNFRVSVNIRFGDIGPFKNEPVLQTLVRIAELVSKTIGAFETHRTG